MENHYIDCLIRNHVLTIHLATLHTLWRHLRKRNSWKIIFLVCVPLILQSEMKNWIFWHSNGHTNCINVLTTSVILHGLPFNVFPNRFIFILRVLRKQRDNMFMSLNVVYILTICKIMYFTEKKVFKFQINPTKK